MYRLCLFAGLAIVGSWALVSQSSADQPVKPNQIGRPSGSTPTATSTPLPPPPPAPTVYACTDFQDVSLRDPDYHYILCVTCNAVMSAYECGGGPPEPCVPPNNYPYFRPAYAWAGTRGEVAKVLARAAGFNEPIPPNQMTFSDVPPGNPYWVYIERMAGRGLILGYPDFTFRPQLQMPRGQFASVVANSAGFNDPIPPGQQTFEDITPSHQYWQTVERLALRGIVDGYPCGGSGEPCQPPNNRPYFRPGNDMNTTSRAEVARTLSRTFFATCPATILTPTSTPSNTPTATPTSVPPNTPTVTSTIVPTNTPTLTRTSVPTNTLTSTPTFILTVTPIRTLTPTPDSTTTYPPIATSTPIPTYTPALVGTSTHTSTPGTSTTPAITRTPTVIPAGTATHTPTVTGTPCAIQFSDVDPTNPFYAYVRCLACRGIVNGYADGTFRPYADVTRGQLTKILSNAANISDAIPTTQQTFEDVPASQPFWLWIERLVLHQAISGYGCGGPGEPCNLPGNRPYFRPGASATRGQLAKIDALVAQLADPIPSERHTFEDVPRSNPFWLWIEQLAGRGIISGYNCGGPGEPCNPTANRPYFRWSASTTRGQMTKIGSNSFFPNCQIQLSFLGP